jgi:hypothetical protein
MGMGTTNVMERIIASLYQGGPAVVSFRLSLDVPNGGVLLALPALLATGLLCHVVEHFRIPNGYYGQHLSIIGFHGASSGEIR